MKRFRLLSAIWAGIVATLVMTVVMYIFELDLMEMLGTHAGQKGFAASLIGAVIHFAIGIGYALLYAIIFQPLMHKLPGFLSGAIYSLLPFVIALVGMQQFLELTRMVFNVEGCGPHHMCHPGGLNMAPWLISLINHVIYGVVLGLVYRPHEVSTHRP